MVPEIERSPLLCAAEVHIGNCFAFSLKRPVRTYIKWIKTARRYLMDGFAIRVSSSANARRRTCAGRIMRMSLHFSRWGTFQQHVFIRRKVLY